MLVSSQLIATAETYDWTALFALLVNDYINWQLTMSSYSPKNS